MFLLLIVPAWMQDEGKKRWLRIRGRVWLLCRVSILRFVLALCIIHHLMSLSFSLSFTSSYHLLSSVPFLSSQTGSTWSRVSGVERSRAPVSPSHYSHTCKPAHSSPPRPRSLHKSKKESDRGGRRDSERKSERGWAGGRIRH